MAEACTSRTVFGERLPSRCRVLKSQPHQATFTAAQIDDDQSFTIRYSCEHLPWTLADVLDCLLGVASEAIVETKGCRPRM